MINLYLFIELLKAADPSAAIAEIRRVEVSGCTVKNAVQLADDKIVAHFDCAEGVDATALVLKGIMGVEGVVQTNIISAVKPRDG